MVIQEIDGVEFKLKEQCDLTWVKRYGTVFDVIDATGSGCICFGIGDNIEKYFVKIAGVDTVEAEMSPEESVEVLKNAVELYQTLSHPNLVRLLDHYLYKDYYVAVFEWVEGECLFDYWNFDKYAQEPGLKNPKIRFKELSVKKKLSSLEGIFSFLETVADNNYVAVDFYDGSLIYDFNTERITICDIDLFRKQPAFNDIGENFWGTKRLKAPEEYVYGSCIDEITNVFTLGALIFDLFGEFSHKEIKNRYLTNQFVPCTLDKWELNEKCYDVVSQAVSIERNSRYKTISDFHMAFRLGNMQNS